VRKRGLGVALYLASCDKSGIIDLDGWDRRMMLSNRRCPLAVVAVVDQVSVPSSGGLVFYFSHPMFVCHDDPEYDEGLNDVEAEWERSYRDDLKEIIAGSHLDPQLLIDVPEAISSTMNLVYISSRSRHTALA